jgi:hypothetical protein
MCDSRGACRENLFSAVILQHEEAERNSALCIEGRGSVDGSQFNYTSAQVVHMADLIFLSGTLKRLSLMKICYSANQVKHEQQVRIFF